MAFMEIVYMKLPFPSLKTKDAYIWFSKKAFRIYPKVLLGLRYPKIDIYDFQNRLIVYIVTVSPRPNIGNSIYITSFSKIVYSFQLRPRFTDTWEYPVNSTQSDTFRSPVGFKLGMVTNQVKSSPLILRFWRGDIKAGSLAKNSLL